MSKLSILPQVRDNFKIDSLVAKPQNIGKISEQEVKEQNAKLFRFEYGTCQSGLKLNIYWAISSEERVIDCKMEVFGESELIAAASMAGLVAKNKTPQEILQLKEKGLEYFLRQNPNTPALPKRVRFITNVVMDALYMAAKAYKGEPVEQEEIIDPVSNVSLRFIKESIERFDITDIQDLIDYTRAGAFNKSIIAPGNLSSPSGHYLVDILRQVRNEMEAKKKEAYRLSDKPFKELDTEQKKAAINAIIDQHIRHMLIMDGGDMEILDVKDNGENTDIYIRYLGACNGCASANTGTLFAIEGILKQKLGDNIRVIPL